jgi:hypothetical protein
MDIDDMALIGPDVKLREVKFGLICLEFVINTYNEIYSLGSCDTSKAHAGFCQHIHHKYCFNIKQSC